MARREQRGASVRSRTGVVIRSQRLPTPRACRGTRGVRWLVRERAAAGRSRIAGRSRTADGRRKPSRARRR
eukprot:1267995-Prymnesium_polylepis.1